MIDLGVQVIIRRHPTGSTPRANLAGGITTGLARQIRERVRERGKPVQAFTGYSRLGEDNTTRKGEPQYGYTVSPAYPVPAAGARVSRTGKLAYRSSRDFHDKAGVKAGTFDVSGGMWRGLTLEINGDRRGAIVFRGRSQGKDANTATEKQRAAAKGRGKKAARAREVIQRRMTRGRQISNALKAASIRRSLGVNLLSLQSGEFEAVGEATARIVKTGLDTGFSAVIAWGPTTTGAADRRTVDKILRAVQARAGSL